MNPFKHPGAKRIPELDVEKHAESKESSEVKVTANTDAGAISPVATSSPPLGHGTPHDTVSTPVLLKGKLGEWNDKVEGLAGLEARGITRVLPGEKHGGGIRGHVQMFLLWFSLNLVANNIITGFFGPLVFGLGWKDSVLIVIFASALGTCGPAYTATFGPESGNRTMVSSSFQRCSIELHEHSLNKEIQPRRVPIADAVFPQIRSLVGTSWDIGLRNLYVS